MYDEARLLAAHDGAEPVAKEACLAIGDRLDTDIEAGNRGGYDSLAVLTGVTNPHELMFAPEHLRHRHHQRRRSSRGLRRHVGCGGSRTQRRRHDRAGIPNRLIAARAYAQHE